MKRFTKFLFAALITVLTLFGVFACGKGKVKPQEVFDEARKMELITYAEGDTINSVTKNVTLKDKITPTVKEKKYEVTITWTSNRENVISTKGVVVRPTDENAEVSLTATLSFNDKENVKDFSLRVLKKEGEVTPVKTDEQKVNEDLAALTIDTKDLTTVGEGPTLPATGANGTTITWESNNTELVGHDGRVVKLPEESNKIITLTAKVKSGSIEKTKNFDLNVIKDPTEEHLAADAVALTVTPTVLTEVGQQVTLPQTGTNGSAITWASSNTELLGNDGKVVALPTTDAEVTLTATLTLKGKTTTRELKVTVKFQRTDEQKVAEDLAALNIDTTNLTKEEQSVELPKQGSVNGLAITWVSSDTSILGNDGKVVALPTDADATITLTATITSGEKSDTKTFNIVVEKKKEYEVATLQYPEGTTIQKDQLSLDTKYEDHLIADAAIRANFKIRSDKTPKYGNFVGLNKDGTFRLNGDKESGNGNTLTIEALNGKIITFVEVVFKTANDKMKDENSPSAKIFLGEEVKDLVGVANVGDATHTYTDLNISVLKLKNTQYSLSGKTALIGISKITLHFKDAAPLTADEKLAKDKADLNINTSALIEGQTVTLPTTGENGSQIAWASSHEAILGTNGKVVAVPAEDTTVTLTATLTLEGATAPLTKEFQIVVKKAGTQSFTVTFDTKGGSGEFPQVSVLSGEKVTEPTGAPVLTNKTFTHWSLEGETTAYDFNLPVTGNITLVANYIDVVYPKISEVRGKALNETVMFKGIVSGIALNNPTHGTEGSYVYFVEDETAAIMIYSYSGANAHTIKVGDELMVTGNLGEFKGQIQIVGSALVPLNLEVLSNDNTLQPVQEINSLTELLALTADSQGKRIKISGLEFQSKDGSSTNRVILVEGTNTIKLTVQSNSDAKPANKALLDKLASLVVGDTLLLDGVHIGWYESIQLALTNELSLSVMVMAEHTVTFDVDGNTTKFPAIQVKEGKFASKPATNPEKAGFSFDFWTLDGTTEFLFNTTPINGPITLKAKFTEYTDSEKLIDEGVDLTLDKTELSTVGESVTLPANGIKYPAIAITWVSSNQALVGNDGVVVDLPLVDTEVTFTATLKLNEATETTTLKVTVKSGIPNADKVAADKAALTVDKTQILTTTETVGLAATGSVHGSNITWATSHDAILSNAGIVVALPAEDTTVTLTATIKNGNAQDTKEFQIVVKKAGTQIFSVTFEIGAATGSFPEVYVVENEQLSEPLNKPVPNDNNKVFNFWALSTDLTKAYVFTDPVVANIILEAVYREKTDAEKLAEDAAALTSIDRTEFTEVNQTATLPLVGALGSNIAWVSSDTSVIDNSGKMIAYPSADQTIILTATLTLGEEPAVTKTFEVQVYALRHLVTFNTNGANETVENQNVIHGQYAQDPAITLTKAGFTFKHWAKADNPDIAFGFGTTAITESITLYAQWEAVAAEQTVTYDFGKSSKETGSSVTSTQLEKLFDDGKGATEEDIITSVVVDSTDNAVYDGNGSGGNLYQNKSGLIKLGKTKGGGKFAINFSKDIKKIEMEVVAWSSGDNFTINNQKFTPTKDSKSAEKDIITVDFATPTNQVVVSTATKKRVLIFKIKVTY